MKKKNEKKKVSPIKQVPLRRPGSFLLYQILKKFSILFLVWFTPIVLWVGIMIGISLSSFLNKIYAFEISMILISIWGLLICIYRKRIEQSMDNLFLGYEGEVFVGEVLDSLKEKGCKIIHDFQYTHCKGKSNIDHIIIAPQGVFTVETKTVSKIESSDEKIVYDGETVRLNSGRPLENPLNQAEAEARALKEFIYKQCKKEIFVRPIVVYPNWYIIDKSNSNNRKVFVWTHKYFANNIPDMPVILQDEDINCIYEALAEHSRKS